MDKQENGFWKLVKIVFAVLAVLAALAAGAALIARLHDRRKGRETINVWLDDDEDDGVEYAAAPLSADDRDEEE